jgi:hypothetical protein
MINGTFTITNWTITNIQLIITTNTPILLTNITIKTITIEAKEPNQCPTPPMIKALTNPGQTILLTLTATPIAAALPMTPQARISRKIRQTLITLGLVLTLLFYLAWALGFTNIAPQLYNPETLKILGTLFIAGVILLLATTLLTTTKQTQNT